MQNKKKLKQKTLTHTHNSIETKQNKTKEKNQWKKTVLKCVKRVKRNLNASFWTEWRRRKSVNVMKQKSKYKPIYWMKIFLYKLLFTK